MSDAEIAQKAPYEVALEADKNYAWCACGRSAKQPFCDGSHSVTDLRPSIFKVDKADRYWLCGCKRTANSPYCDGTHSSL